jgi:hypothetical protein
VARKTKLEITSFNKGLITEAGPLTFPDNASLVDTNMVLNKDGSRQRRLGLTYDGDIEDNFAGGASDNSELNCFLWENPTQTGAYDIVVVQVHDNLYFYNSKAEVIGEAPLNTGGSTISLPASYVEGTVVSADSIRGQLIIACGDEVFLVLSYDEATDTVSSQEKRLTVRDVWGIESIYALDERPAIANTVLVANTQTVALDADLVQHVYNLRNQGWPSSHRTNTDTDGSGYHRTYDTILLPDVDDDSIADVDFLVADSDVPWRARLTASEFVQTIGLYSPFEVYKNFYGSTPANKGKAIIDLFDRATDRQAFYDELAEQSEMVIEGDSIVSDSATGGISQVAAYAGRIFYAITNEEIIDEDERSPRLSNYIFYSQVVKSDLEISRCYQLNDPTSEFEYDVIATDGGFISIPEAGKILRLAPLGSSLFVICTNGVWEIHGGEQVFSATNQNLTKTSNIGAISASSVVVSESLLSYFANGGIYLISIDPSSLRGVASNLTASTINSLYLAIPNDQKAKAKGIFDEVDRKVRWLYRDSDYGFPNVYNKELVFDVDLQAFYLNTFEVDDSEEADTQIGVRGFFTVPELKYWIVKDSGASSIFYGFGSYSNTNFEDFGLYDAPATLLTGYLTGGTGSTDKRVVSFVAHFNRTETGFQEVDDALEFINPSSCIVTPQWEWTNHVNAGKWGTPFQAYRLQRPYYPTGEEDPFNYGYTVITTKSGIRGRGKALSLKFESEPLKDMHILGWGLELVVDDKY